MCDQIRYRVHNLLVHFHNEFVPTFPTTHTLLFHLVFVAVVVAVVVIVVVVVVVVCPDPTF